jgi:hypothetical protein
MVADRDKADDAQVQAFVTELMGFADEFTWSVDRYGQIRGKCKELPPRLKAMCPLTAAAYKATGHICNTSHEAAEVLAMGVVSLELTDAIDNFVVHRWRNWILEALGLAQ